MASAAAPGGGGGGAGSWESGPTVSTELFSLTHGAIVRQILSDCGGDAGMFVRSVSWKMCVYACVLMSFISL